MPLCVHLTVLAVAVIYYSWRDGYWAPMLRSKCLRQRVAYMLWTAANQAA